MGMFDYVMVEMPLPEPAPPAGTEFQTKTFDPLFDRYIIKPDGRLLRRRKDVLDGGWVLGPEIEVPYHGDLEFYAYDRATGESWDYVARFTEGRCVRIWAAEPS